MSTPFPPENEELQRFGSKLRALRKKHNLTQDRLGTILGISQGYVTELERSGRIPHTPLVVKISRYFEVPVDVLVKDELDLE